MQLIVEKSTLKGQVPIPGSKSHTIRAVAIASLADGTSEIVSPLDSADTRSAVNAYRHLGAQIDTTSQSWKIQGTAGKLSVPEDIIDVGNSGTTLRFALASSALLKDGAAVFTGDHQIRSRPAGPLLRSLNDLGADTYSTRGNGQAPIVVNPCMIGGQTSIEALTSQYVSALLINTPLAEKDTIINVTKLNEIPYVEITLDYLDEMGIQYTRDGMQQFNITGCQGYKPFTKRIPADFSSATFFLCAAAFLDAEVTLEGLDFSDPQGDKAVVDMLKAMGADITIDGTLVHVKGGQLTGTDIDMNATPDALPAMAVTACFAQGTTRLLNVPQARMKETDRISVMNKELSKMGATIEELPDGLVIQHSSLKPASDLSGHDDHRIVMALSLAAMALDSPSTIATAQAMAITFPNFVDLMASIGAKMKLAE